MLEGEHQRQVASPRVKGRKDSMTFGSEDAVTSSGGAGREPRSGIQRNKPLRYSRGRTKAEHVPLVLLSQALDNAVMQRSATLPSSARRSRQENGAEAATLGRDRPHSDHRVGSGWPQPPLLDDAPSQGTPGRALDRASSVRRAAENDYMVAKDSVDVTAMPRLLSGPSAAAAASVADDFDDFDGCGSEYMAVTQPTSAMPSSHSAGQVYQAMMGVGVDPPQMEYMDMDEVDNSARHLPPASPAPRMSAGSPSAGRQAMANPRSPSMRRPGSFRTNQMPSPQVTPRAGVAPGSEYMAMQSPDSPNASGQTTTNPRSPSMRRPGSFRTNQMPSPQVTPRAGVAPGSEYMAMQSPDSPDVGRQASANPRSPSMRRPGSFHAKPMPSPQVTPRAGVAPGSEYMAMQSSDSPNVSRQTTANPRSPSMRRPGSFHGNPMPSPQVQPRAAVAAAPAASEYMDMEDVASSANQPSAPQFSAAPMPMPASNEYMGLQDMGAFASTAPPPSARKLERSSTSPSLGAASRPQFDPPPMAYGPGAGGSDGNYYQATSPHVASDAPATNAGMDLYMALADEDDEVLMPPPPPISSIPQSPPTTPKANASGLSRSATIAAPKSAVSRPPAATPRNGDTKTLDGAKVKDLNDGKQRVSKGSFLGFFRKRSSTQLLATASSDAPSQQASRDPLPTTYSPGPAGEQAPPSMSPSLSHHAQQQVPLQRSPGSFPVVQQYSSPDLLYQEPANNVYQPPVYEPGPGQSYNTAQPPPAQPSGMDLYMALTGDDDDDDDWTPTAPTQRPIVAATSQPTGGPQPNATNNTARPAPITPITPPIDQKIRGTHRMSFHNQTPPPERIDEEAEDFECEDAVEIPKARKAGVVSSEQRQSEWSVNGRVGYEAPVHQQHAVIHPQQVPPNENMYLAMDQNPPQEPGGTYMPSKAAAPQPTATINSRMNTTSPRHRAAESDSNPESCYPSEIESDYDWAQQYSDDDDFSSIVAPGVEGGRSAAGSAAIPTYDTDDECKEVALARRLNRNKRPSLIPAYESDEERMENYLGRQKSRNFITNKKA